MNREPCDGVPRTSPAIRLEFKKINPDYLDHLVTGRLG
jgi:hypothetical protein